MMCILTGNGLACFCNNANGLANSHKQKEHQKEIGNGHCTNGNTNAKYHLGNDSVQLFGIGIFPKFETLENGQGRQASQKHKCEQDGKPTMY